MGWKLEEELAGNAKVNRQTDARPRNIICPVFQTGM